MTRYCSVTRLAHAHEHVFCVWFFFSGWLILLILILLILCSTVAQLWLILFFFFSCFAFVVLSIMDKEDEVMIRPRWCRCFHSPLFSHKACSHPRKWWSVLLFGEETGWLILLILHSSRGFARGHRWRREGMRRRRLGCPLVDSLLNPHSEALREGAGGVERGCGWGVATVSEPPLRGFARAPVASVGGGGGGGKGVALDSLPLPLPRSEVVREGAGGWL